MSDDFLLGFYKPIQTRITLNINDGFIGPLSRTTTSLLHRNSSRPPANAWSAGCLDMATPTECRHLPMSGPTHSMCGPRHRPPPQKTPETCASIAAAMR